VAYSTARKPAEVERNSEQSYCSSQRKPALAVGSLPRRFNGLSSQKIPEKLQGIGIQSAGNSDEFNQVDPSFAALIFGDERLGAAKPLSQRLLAYARAMSHCDKQLN
jgi:hypothetical protein